MEGRNRLIELFKEMDKNPEITCPNPDNAEACKSCEYAVTEWLCDIEARKADYLLANGAFLPPCRVGDTVWYELYGKIESAVVYSCVGVFKKQGVEITDANAKSSDGLEVAFTGKCIGKTVFLTKEEAERALKEREGK